MPERNFTQVTALGEAEMKVSDPLRTWAIISMIALMSLVVHLAADRGAGAIACAIIFATSIWAFAHKV